MSKTIDERVVSMQFDNSRFEKNVSTTMSTLDKLKEKLSFRGATKGLENVSSAAGKVNMNPLSNAVETVSSRFSALEVMGVTALANITNSAVNAGKRMISALTLDPIKTGFQEYETQINAVQTILANTESKGTTIDQVNEALETLNAYADKTIYNFTEMTRNIGTFTAAGVDLGTSVSAIQGIANLAAVSGSNSQQASTAMYQLSQALSSGTVKLMDWNSVVNAGMGGQVFQDALKETARVHGVAIDEMIEDQGSFRETLSEGWLTADILTETLEKFTMATEGATEAEIEANRTKLKGLGYTDEQIEAIFKLGNTATNAATKVKTFTQLWDVLKESAQSGWSQTWKLVVGDFEQAKELLTPLADFLTGAIGKMSDARNKLVEGALHFTRPWTELTKKLGKTVEVISDMTDKVEYFQDIVDQVWRGDFGVRGGDPDRFDLLAQAGYDPRVVQDLVNKGYQYKITVEDIEESHKKFGLTMEKTEESTDSMISSLENMTEEERKHLGITEDEIEMYKALAKEAERTGRSIEDIAKEMSENDGRTLLFDGFKNIGMSIVAIFTAIKNAWVEIFPPMTIVQLYNIIRAFNEFTQKLRLTDKETGELNETGQNIYRTFKGIFAVVDIITTILGGAFKIAFGIAEELLSHFGLGILDVTAFIGDALVGFRDWIDTVLDFSGVVEKIAPYIQTAAEAIKGWIDTLKESDNIPRDIILGLAKGIYKGIPMVAEAMWELGKSLLLKICEVLRIHSPSREFFEVGKNIILGLFEGIKFAGSLVWDLIKSTGEKCIEVIKNLDFGKVLASVVGVGMTVAAIKFASALENFTSPLDGLGEMFESIGGMFEGLESKFKADAWEKRSRIIINLAIAIAILAASMYILGKMDKDQLIQAGIAVGVLAVIVGGLLALAAVLNKSDKNFIKASVSMASITMSLFLLAAALTLISKIKIDDLDTTATILLVAIVGLLGVLAAVRMFINPKTETDLRRVGTMTKRIAIALLLMVGVIKLASMLQPDEAKRGFFIVAALEVLILGLIAVSKVSGEFSSKVGTMLLKVSIAMMLMIGVIKLAAQLDRSEIKRATPVILLFGGLILALIAVSKLAGEFSSKAGSAILKISIAMLLMIGVIKLASRLEEGELRKALPVIVLFGGIVAALIAVSNLAGKHAAKAGTMLLMVAGALVILTGVIFILGELDPDGLKRGVTAISILMACFAGLIAVTKLAKNGKYLKGELIAMIVAIGLLALAAAGLSFIEPKRLLASTGALTIVISSLALLISSTKNLKITKKNKGTLWNMVGIIGVLALIVAGLSFTDPKKALPNCAALVVLMATFAASLAIMGKAGKISSTVSKQIWPMLAVVTALGLIIAGLSFIDNPRSVIANCLALSILMATFATSLVIMSKAGKVLPTVSKQIWPMLGVVAGLAVILGLMSALNVSASIGSAIALSVLLNAMAAALLVLSLIVKPSNSAVGSMALLGLVVAELAVILGLMSWLNLEASMNNVLALSALLVVMTGVLAVLSVLGLLSASAYAGVGAMFLLGLVIAELAVILGLMAHFDINPSMETACALSTLLLAMSAALVVLGVVGLLGPAAFTGIGALATLIAGIGGLVVAIGFLVTEFPILETFLDTGIPIIEKIGYAIGSFFGNVVGGFSAGAMSGLPEIGTYLSQFMENAKPFIEGVKMVDASVLAGVGILTACIAALLVADFVNEIASFMSLMVGGGGSTFADLGTELSDFMENAKGFIEGASMINDSMMAGVKSLAEALIVLTAANIIDGLARMFSADCSLSSFAEQLPTVGLHLAKFAQNLGTFDEEKVTTVTCAAAAIKAIAEAAHQIPNEGGLWAKIVGENSLATFGGYLPNLGKHLAGFVTNLGTFTEAEIATVDCAANAIRLMAESANEIPNDGGLWGKLCGDNSLATFGGYLPNLGKHLSKFVANLGTFDESQIATVDCAAKAVKAMAEAAHKIPNEDGLWAKIFGDNSLATFGGHLPGLGTNLKDFVGSLGTFSEGQVNTVTSAVRAIHGFTMLANTDLKGMAKDLPDFHKELPSLGTSISDFTENLTVNSADVDAAAVNLKNLAAALKSLDGVKPADVINFVAELNALSQTMVNEFITNFTNESAYIKVKHAASTMIGYVITSLRSAYSEFESAGSYLVDGFAAGISQNTYKASAKAAAMASAAANAARVKLKVNSPSKVGYEIGDFFGLGFVNAIDDYADVSYKAGRGMATAAHTGLNEAMKSASDSFNDALGSEPTIRPVIDLTSVRRGADAIGDMLNMGTSVGVLARVGAINSAINQRNQNGDNSDVVAELRKLGKKLDGVGSNTYNSIGDISYDDGSTIGKAIHEITRAAIVERRV